MRKHLSAMLLLLAALAWIEPTAMAQKRRSTENDRRSVLGSDSTLPGIVQPGRKVDIIAQSDGLLKGVLVKEGQIVKAGQPLAQFDKALAEATVKVAEAAAGGANLKLAQVDLKLAQAELARLESVPDRRALAAVEVDRARAAVDRAKAAVEQAAQLHEQALGALAVERERMDQLTVRAPFDAVVVRLDTQTGASLIRSAPMLTVADLSTLRVEMFVSLKHFHTIKVGQKYQLHGAAPIDRSIVAELISRGPIINAATGTFRCVFEIPNSDGALPAGFTVHFHGQQAPGPIARMSRDRNPAR